MRRRGRRGREPQIYLDGDQPHIYRKRRIRWTSVLKWSSLAILVVLIVLSVFFYIWLKTKESRMRLPGVEKALDKTGKGQPVNTLVIGVDRGSVKGEGGEGRADIMMLVSVNDKSKKAAVISIPRDTRVTIPGHEGYNKINAANALGGTKLSIDTVRDFTGLEINHFVEMDFEGFKHIVDAMGGVPMHIDVAIHDKYAGDVPAGDVVLNGDQALALVRARHDVKAVPAGDLDRIKNQRKFLQAMLSTVSRQRNPFRIMKLVDVASKNIKTDLTFMETLSLGRKLQGHGAGLEMTTAPGQAKVIGGIWYYVVNERNFEELLNTFKTRTEVGTEQPEPESGEEGRSGIKVTVLNGAGVQGMAASVANELKGRGYAEVATGNSRSAYTRTTIYYAGEDGSKAGLVAADLAGVEEPVMERNDDLVGEYEVDAVVVLGSDYKMP